MTEIGGGKFDSDEKDKKEAFRIVDKRFQAEEEAPAAPAPAPPAAKPEPKGAKTIHIDTPSAAATAVQDEPDLAGMEGESDTTTAPAGPEGDPLTIQNALYFFIEEVYSRVLVYMGVAPHPQSGLTVQNLDEAQQGIKLIEVLVAEAKKKSPPEVQAGLDRVVQQIKLAYVQLVTGGGRGATPGGPIIS